MRVALSWGSGFARGCAIQAAALAWLAGLAGVGALVFPLLDRHARQWVMPGVLVTWVGTLLPATLLIGVWVVLRRNRRLDEAFAAFGPGRALAPVARAWAGVRDGRDVNVWFSKGPQVEMYVACRTGTEAGIVPENALSSFAAQVLSREIVRLPGGLSAHGDDTAWVRAFTARGSDALATLLSDPDAGRCNVTVLPDAVKLTMRRHALETVTADNAERWYITLRALAEVAESIPPPVERKEAAGLAARMRTHRGTGLGFIAITGGCFVALLVFIVATTAAIMLVSG